jgi:hypothetical protein
MGGFSFAWLADGAGTLADFGGYSSSFLLFHMMKIPFHKDETMLLLFTRVLRGQSYPIQDEPEGAACF